MPLLNERILHAALIEFKAHPATAEQIEAADDWARRARDPGFELQNESQLEQEFNRVILQQVLGYAARVPGSAGTMQVKQSVPGGTIVDVALGTFSDDETAILAPLELKGPSVSLDRIMPGRAKTPVQQAWNYAMDVPGSRWVLVSNLKEMRLYAFGHGRQDYESFDLRKIDQPDELTRFRLLLGADKLLTGATRSLLKRSASADQDITEKLYQDYKQLRSNLMAFVAAQHPHVSIEDRIRGVQTLLDRVLFIAFAEDKNLLPQRILAEALGPPNKFRPIAKWEQLTTLFDWIDQGAPPHNIPKYNGGLFKKNPTLDGFALPDHLVDQFSDIANYDFASEVSVTILGHIFEQSITDIENEKAVAGLEAPPPATKKKREGVVYTPDFITRFIVEQTVGLHLAEIEAELIPKFGKRGEDGTVSWHNKKSAEADFWTAYLNRIGTLRILDPACGSGAFLIAAFNFLHAEQKRVRDRLSELQPGILTHLAPNADIQIITNNLFGVDVNAESVEITKLALWLQTAKRERALESLDDNIKHGNSLVTSDEFHPRPFIWEDEFPDILCEGEGFDIVLGNPPYVRMELLKSIKPHLEERFSVSTDRADLYAYFFELGVDLLKTNGRLGFISSSTFFRTGSGKLLRAFLAEKTSVESVIDFGDLQVFEGVTTYPAIVTLRKNQGTGINRAVRYLIARELPDDLSKTFDEEGRAMPEERLSGNTWRFENSILDGIREKIGRARQTLAQVYGPPLYGIKTGYNKALVLRGKDRDLISERATIEEDDKSLDLLKPFLVGQNLKRWHVESDNSWLVYTPKNAIKIDDYPALRDYLAPFRERLERRATNQKWWELQQAQANYELAFLSPKVIYPHFNDKPNFSFDAEQYYSNDKSYIIPTDSPALAGYLNSTLAWFQLCGLAPAVRGGFREARVQYVGALYVPERSEMEAILEAPSRQADEAAKAHEALVRSVLHRLDDLHPKVSSTKAMRKWPSDDFAALQASLKKRFKVSIPVGERDDWERWYEARRDEAAVLRHQVVEAEDQINLKVFRMFGLTKTEIAAVEDAVAIASPSLNLRSYEAISAVEGLELSDEARKRLVRRASERVSA